MDSILGTIKQMLGILNGNTAYDTELVNNINFAISELHQLGAVSSFSITGSTEIWTDFLGEPLLNLESIKSYIFLKVRKTFDLSVSFINTNSIFDTIKKMLGISSSDTAFDIDLVVNINSALMALNQLGIGPVGGFSITGLTETWTDLLGNSIKFEAVKSYIYLKVKLLFDPPTSSTFLDAMTRQITELEWRITAQAEPPLVIVPIEEEEYEF
jgi:hypothetical protein